jgi:hypothetical protein
LGGRILIRYFNIRLPTASSQHDCLVNTSITCGLISGWARIAAQTTVHRTPFDTVRRNQIRGLRVRVKRKLYQETLKTLARLAGFERQRGSEPI